MWGLAIVSKHPHTQTVSQTSEYMKAAGSEQTGRLEEILPPAGMLSNRLVMWRGIVQENNSKLRLWVWVCVSTLPQTSAWVCSHVCEGVSRSRRSPTELGRQVSVSDPRSSRPHLLRLSLTFLVVSGVGVVFNGSLLTGLDPGAGPAAAEPLCSHLQTPVRYSTEQLTCGYTDRGAAELLGSAPGVTLKDKRQRTDRKL